MYLSRLVLDAGTRPAQVLLHDPYRLHQALLTAFPPDAPGGGGRVLFRVEPEGPDGAAVVLVQSVLPPDWKAAVARCGLPVKRADGPKEVHLELVAGQRLRFRLRANPTRRSEGKRLAVIGEEAQLGWLRRKLGAVGLTLGAAQQHDEGLVRSRRSPDAPPMSFKSVLFEGLAEVTDPTQAAAAIEAGLGSAKAFGFGLLSVSRA